MKQFLARLLQPSRPDEHDKPDKRDHDYLRFSTVTEDGYICYYNPVPKCKHVLLLKLDKETQTLSGEWSLKDAKPYQAKMVFSKQHSDIEGLLRELVKLYFEECSKGYESCFLTHARDKLGIDMNIELNRPVLLPETEEVEVNQYKTDDKCLPDTLVRSLLEVYRRHPEAEDINLETKGVPVETIQLYNASNDNRLNIMTSECLIGMTGFENKVMMEIELFRNHNGHRRVKNMIRLMFENPSAKIIREFLKVYLNHRTLHGKMMVEISKLQTHYGDRVSLYKTSRLEIPVKKGKEE